MLQILDCAAVCFYENGYHATSVEDVARKVGIYKGSLYYYIRSKEDLLFAVLHGVISSGAAKILDSCSKVSDPLTQLESALCIHLDHIYKNHVRIALFFDEFRFLRGDRRKLIIHELMNYQQVFEGFVRKGQAHNLIVPGDPAVLVNALLGACNSFYRGHAFRKLPARCDLKQVLIPMLIRGVRHIGIV